MDAVLGVPLPARIAGVAVCPTAGVTAAANVATIANKRTSCRRAFMPTSHSTA